MGSYANACVRVLHFCRDRRLLFVLLIAFQKPTAYEIVLMTGGKEKKWPINVRNCS